MNLGQNLQVGQIYRHIYYSYGRAFDRLVAVLAITPETMTIQSINTNDGSNQGPRTVKRENFFKKSQVNLTKEDLNGMQKQRYNQVMASAVLPNPGAPMQIYKQTKGPTLSDIREGKRGECYEMTNRTLLVLNDPDLLLDLETLDIVEKEEIEVPYALKRNMTINIA